MFPSSWGDGVDTIGKNIKIIIGHVEFDLFHELYLKLGALHLADGGGAKHSPPCQRLPGCLAAEARIDTRRNECHKS